MQRREAGITLPQFRHPAKAGIQETGTEPVALDTGFRRYDASLLTKGATGRRHAGVRVQLCRSRLAHAAVIPR